jgi:hypothetical protein
MDDNGSNREERAKTNKPTASSSILSLETARRVRGQQQHIHLPFPSTTAGNGPRMHLLDGQKMPQKRYKYHKH